ncbi:MAG TPA: hypothetical protein VD963_02080 [Phycisphaerales bacterium]|nr:hypothetical protein [Phycisphaerales bacterium]
MPATEAVKRPKRIHEVVAGLGFPNWVTAADADVISWPPNLFAIAMILLRDSGAYLNVAKPPAELGVLEITAGQWQEKVRKIGKEWSLDAHKIPSPVVAAWAIVKTHAELSLTAIRAQDELWKTLLFLAAVTDEACAGVGVLGRLEDLWESLESIEHLSVDQAVAAVERTVQYRATQRLISWSKAHEQDEKVSLENASTLCDGIHQSRAIVLPKMRTPQRGISIRSLSHNLALFTGCDVAPAWLVTRDGARLEGAGATRRRRTFNVLVYPHPFRIDPVQFRPIKGHDATCARMASHCGLFEYDAREHESTLGGLNRILDGTDASVGRIDMVVLPEMAASRMQVDKEWRQGTPRDVPVFVCGVCEPPTDTQLGRNYAMVRCPAPSDNDDATVEVFEATQHKHHRWALDDAQIRMYGLSRGLDPGTLWWEGIQLDERNVYFFTLDEDYIFSVMICEDLARPDPVGELVRAVGPNLVVALLQDGPQISQRWACRYATALSDDPGCSVLTVTSLGMTRLSRPGDFRAEHARKVAMWRDQVTGFREFALPENAHALVLTLTETSVREYTADGRDDREQAGCLRLGGVHFLDAEGRCV